MSSRGVCACEPVLKILQDNGGYNADPGPQELLCFRQRLSLAKFANLDKSEFLESSSCK